MKKIICTLLLSVCLFGLTAKAEENQTNNITEQNAITEEIKLQNHISEVGFKILNANQIEKRMIFVYDKKNLIIKGEPGLSKRQIIVYKNTMNFIENDAELSAYLAREICKTAESYSGRLKGIVSSLQIKAAPKKYEIFFDKRAVDYLVKAGYNPVVLIIYLNKTGSQKRYDQLARTNLISKRLANIYEYIYFQYPYFLANNEYLYNEYYQNFLLTSTENRRKLENKVKKGLTGKVKYE